MKKCYKFLSNCTDIYFNERDIKKNSLTYFVVSYNWCFNSWEKVRHDTIEERKINRGQFCNIHVFHWEEQNLKEKSKKLEENWNFFWLISSLYNPSRLDTFYFQPFLICNEQENLSQIKIKHVMILLHSQQWHYQLYSLCLCQVQNIYLSSKSFHLSSCTMIMMKERKKTKTDADSPLHLALLDLNVSFSLHISTQKPMHADRNHNGLVSIIAGWPSCKEWTLFWLNAADWNRRKWLRVN